MTVQNKPHVGHIRASLGEVMRWSRPGARTKSVAAFAPAGVASGYQNSPTIETGKETVLYYEDTTPLNISNGGGVAAPTRSMFQTDVIAIKVRAECAYAAATGAAQVITAVNW